MLFHYGIARLFPLDGCRRFGRDVIDNAVDPLDLVYDAVADLGQEIIWEMEPVCRHSVGGNHGTKRYRILVSPFVTHDTYALDRKKGS